MNKKTILAIDVGTSMVKVFAGILQTDGSLEILGSGAAPTAGYVRGIITDINALTHSIRQAVDCVAMVADGQAAGCVYLGISGSTLIAQNSIGSIAPTTPGILALSDVERACKAAVFIVEDNDYEVLHVFSAKESKAHPGEALEVEAHIVSAPRVILQSLTNALAGIGLNLTGTVAGGIMAAETIKNELLVQPNNFIIMDIGAGTTDLVIYIGGNLCFSASLPLGGDYITSDLMQGLGVSRSHAEEIKRYYSRLSPDLHHQGVVLDCNDYGTTDKHIPFDFLYDIIESRVDEIVALVYEHVKSLLVQHPSDQEQTFECIYLTGGSGAMPSMVACIAKIFQVHTETVRLTQQAVEYAHPANTVCYGIINYGVKNLPSEAFDGRNAWNLFIHTVKRLLKI